MNRAEVAKIRDYPRTLIPSDTRSNAKVDVCVSFGSFAWLPIDKKASSFSSKNLRIFFLASCRFQHGNTLYFFLRSNDLRLLSRFKHRNKLSMLLKLLFWLYLSERKYYKYIKSLRFLSLCIYNTKRSVFTFVMVNRSLIALTLDLE